MNRSVFHKAISHFHQQVESCNVEPNWNVVTDKRVYMKKDMACTKDKHLTLKLSLDWLSVFDTQDFTPLARKLDATPSDDG